jgi:hypothetical protein
MSTAAAVDHAGAPLNTSVIGAAVGWGAAAAAAATVTEFDAAAAAAAAAAVGADACACACAGVRLSCGWSFGLGECGGE